MQSCFNQTDQDFEIIIVNDESTDGSIPIIERIMKKDPRIQLLHQKNQGPAEARNKGLKVAKGKYVSFFDADDLLEPDYLKTLADILDQNPKLGIAMCNASVVDERGVMLKPKLTEESRFDDHPRLQDAIFCQGLWPPSIIMCRLKDALGIGGFYVHPKTRICEDWEFITRLARTGIDYQVVYKSLVRYRQVSGSLGSNPEKTLEAHCLILEKLMKDDAYMSATSLFYVQKLLGKTKSELYAQKQIATGAKSFLQKAIPFLTRAHGKEVLIWGAGSGGQRVLKVLQTTGAQAKAFVDSNAAKAGQIVEGLPVVLPASFINKPKGQRPFVIIASTYAPFIQNDLRAAGWSDDEYDIADFDVVSTLEEVLLTKNESAVGAAT